MVLRFTYWACFTCLLMAVARAQTAAAPPNVNAIVIRMMSAQQENKAHLRPFMIKRGYLLMDKKQEPKAQVVANITVLPGNKQFWIESSSGGMGEKVLREILSKETEPPKEAQKKEISPENYDFGLLGEQTLEGHHCYLLALNPKRDEKDLIRGKIWVDAASYNILRVEGSPVKTPSWWIRDLYILMNFAEVDGMWLRTFTHAVANVRFKGRYVMESRDLAYGPVGHTRRSRNSNPEMFTGSVIDP
ncbi:MAG TPA: hypothetical protein VIB39_08665 [Candidatus Angelobacter sp.]